MARGFSSIILLAILSDILVYRTLNNLGRYVLVAVSFDAGSKVPGAREVNILEFMAQITVFICNRRDLEI